ncbi:hypothetical protein HBH99_165840 [Parastagonospora nodorum]|nr:hypothetical protein HBH45_043550 [Parastagonospora nodorum]KAH4387795.1 hypothetical protein HBH99_165840 [Parastagonospora nodorum]KAH4445413.1 hypothetical protein HBH93_060350 [Parastagonospora nodorum]KAH4705603.1 hypothetical protein HBH67_086030 [Parastagonospora nodorum]KAH4860801.1 hypothetical protein HBH75_034400 [Parastagonospora nodorum]
MDGPSQRPPDSLSLAPLSLLSCHSRVPEQPHLQRVSVSIPPTSRTLLSCAALHCRLSSLSLYTACPYQYHTTLPSLFERVSPSLSSQSRPTRACPETPSRLPTIFCLRFDSHH